MNLNTTWNACVSRNTVLEMTLVNSTAVKAVAFDDDKVYVKFNKGEKVYCYTCGVAFNELIKECIIKGGSIGRLMRHLYTTDPSEYGFWVGEVSYKHTL